MINFKQFVEKSLVENSLYTNQAEKDALIKNKQRLLDAFYLNFFGFLGMFSINQLAPLKKYEQSEGKLIVDNIGDMNHDVSLSIKLLYDQKILSRSIVDKMTKLLAKIKMKQIKSPELDENIVRQMLIDMQYTTHRGSPQVMSVIDDFATGKMQLKHVAFHAYALAKKKEYKNITDEFRGIGVYYSGWFKKVGADQPPTATAVAAPVAAPAPVQAAAQPVVQDVQPQQADTKVRRTRKVAVAPKGKTAEFWNALYNARGKTEFNKVFKEYGVADDISNADYVTGIIQAVTVGPIDMDNLKKTYGYITFKDVNFYPFSTVISSHIDKASSVLEIVEPIEKITDRFSKDRIETLLYRSPDVATGPLHQKIISMMKSYLDSLKTRQDLSNVDIKLQLSRLMQAASKKIKMSDVFSLEQSAKLYGLFGVTVVNPTQIKDALKDLMPSVKFELWGATNIDKSTWDSAVDKELSRILKDFSVLDRLEINIVEAKDFSNNLANVVDDSTFREFVSKVVYPLVSLSPTKKLNQDDSTALFNHVVDNLHKFNDVIYVYDILRLYFDRPMRLGGVHWTVTFWDKFYDIALVNYSLGKSNLDKLALAFTLINRYSDLPQKNVEFMKTLESDIVDYFASAILSGRSLDYTTTTTFGQKVSENFLDKYIQKIESKFSSFEYSTFAGLQIDQVLSKSTSETLFKRLEESGWNVTRLDYIVSRLKNKEEFGAWMAQYLEGKTLDKKLEERVVKWMITRFQDFEPTFDQIESAFTLLEIVGNLYAYKSNARMMEYLNKKFIEEAEKEESSYDMSVLITNIIRTDEGILRSIITDETTDSQISGILNKTMSLLDAGKKTSFSRKDWQYISKDTYGFDLKCATLLFQAMGARVFSVEGGEKAVERLAEILMLPSKIKKEYRESVITDISTLFTNAEVNKDTELAFSKFEKKTQKLLGANFAIAQFAGGAVDEINNNAIIKPRSVLPAKGALKVLKLNQVTVPVGSALDLRKARGKDITLQDIKDAAIQAAKTFKLEEQAITPIKHSEEELEKISVVYNRFNRYKHGGIAVRIRRVFDVNVQSQQIGWKEFLDEVTESMKTGTYYHKFPQFHGTASLPASMILRYGFSVIDEKLAREAGIKYAGRMLGDGIYSSNVLDKVSQYINDDAPTGVSRRRGVVGYIFEMDTQGSTWGRTCNVSGADFSTGGTGEFYGERGALVSPEWAWKYANKQCKIKRCFEIELINKDEMDSLVSKHKDVMEAIGYSSFKQFMLSEATNVGVKNYASFTFMDNLVPVGNGKYVDLNEEPEANLNLPSNAIVDHGMYGVTIMFKNDTDYSTRLLYAADIESNAAVRMQYEKLLGKKL